MKQVVEVKIPAKIVKTSAKIKIVEKFSCDICSEAIDTDRDNHYGRGGHTCTLCNRDICRKESCFKWEDNPDDCNGGIRVCIICHPLRYEHYSADYEAMLRRHEKEEENFYNKIKKESLACPR